MEEGNQGNVKRNFKFKELKIYSSTEWLSGNNKKYRQVFDRQKTSYVYAELSFYNKQFDEESWETEVTLICYSVGKKAKEVCNLSFTKKISKFDHVSYIREGWGNKKEGIFWKRGTYYWEAWIEDKKVATKYFYIEEAENWSLPQGNAYVDLSLLKLYEGQYDDIGPDDRTYFKSFSAEETRYIYADICLMNKNFNRSWQCEVFTKFYNEGRELKGQVTRLQTIKKGEEMITLTAGWGSNIKGSWRPGKYTVELVFMNTLLATLPFEVGDIAEEGNLPVLLPDHLKPQFLEEDDFKNLSYEDLMIDLNRLIGLHTIKKQIEEHASYIKFLQLRKDKGFEEKDEINIHSVFIGNPGTGKTTVAGMMGKLYRKMGLLSKGHVHEVDRVDLVGEYIGQTAPKVKEAIEKSRGGVMFIDEAYALARANDDSKDFGREVIEILMKEMSNGPGDIAIIVAGYPDEMKHFLDSNPGLKSRFKFYYDFPDYLPQELLKIAMYACQEKEVKLDEEAQLLIKEMITRSYRDRDKTFGNARFVFDLIEKAKMNLGLRFMKEEDAETATKKVLETISVEDVKNIDAKPANQLPDIPIDEELLEESLQDLNDLIGLSSVKTTIKEMVEIVKYYQSTGQSVLNNFFMHTVFIGNPGTGKTSVARILTRIYKALGILERGHMVETDRQGLVAGFVGQTAIKTSNKIEEAMGGVLFVDEAYALSSGGNGQQDFGVEAIQTLLKKMEDKRGEFYVFVAGYPDNMDRFLKVNPGLSSRFDKILEFEDYNVEELFLIAEKMLGEKKLRITTRAATFIKSYLFEIHKFRDKYFGNARVVRTFIDQVIKNQKLRLAKNALSSKRMGVKDLVIYDDVKDISTDKLMKSIGKTSIGYRR